jgi:hypothetical protein
LRNARQPDVRLSLLDPRVATQDPLRGFSRAGVGISSPIRALILQHARGPGRERDHPRRGKDNESRQMRGVIAIGGSMILGDDFVLNFNSNITTLKVTGGTGRYRHAHGTVIAKTVGNNTDLTINVSP